MNQNKSVTSLKEWVLNDNSYEIRKEGINIKCSQKGRRAYTSKLNLILNELNKSPSLLPIQMKALK